MYELWRLQLCSFGGYGLALAALALVVFGAIECPPVTKNCGMARVWERLLQYSIHTGYGTVLLTVTSHTPCHTP